MNVLHLFIFFQVTSVSCGGNHTVALTEIGEPYSFGSSSNGQLGLGTRILETGTDKSNIVSSQYHIYVILSDKPVKIASLSGIKVVSVSCGENHTAMVTEDGKLLTFGDGRHGKLCLDVETLTNHYTPVPSSRFRVPLLIHEKNL